MRAKTLLNKIQATYYKALPLNYLKYRVDFTGEHVYEKIEGGYTPYASFYALTAADLQDMLKEQEDELNSMVILNRLSEEQIELLGESRCWYWGCVSFHETEKSTRAWVKYPDKALEVLKDRGGRPALRLRRRIMSAMGKEWEVTPRAAVPVVATHDFKMVDVTAHQVKTLMSAGALITARGARWITLSPSSIPPMIKRLKKMRGEMRGAQKRTVTNLLKRLEK